MTKLFVAVMMAAALSGCAARTAYNQDRTQSWTCAPNTQVRQAPLGGREPLVVAEPKR